MLIACKNTGAKLYNMVLIYSQSVGTFFLRVLCSPSSNIADMSGSRPPRMISARATCGRTRSAPPRWSGRGRSTASLRWPNRTRTRRRWWRRSPGPPRRSVNVQRRPHRPSPPPRWPDPGRGQSCRPPPPRPQPLHPPVIWRIWRTRWSVRNSREAGAEVEMLLRNDLNKIPILVIKYFIWSNMSQLLVGSWIMDISLESNIPIP